MAKIWSGDTANSLQASWATKGSLADHAREILPVGHLDAELRVFAIGPLTQSKFSFGVRSNEKVAGQ
jgi:hypothetical protein